MNIKKNCKEFQQYIDIDEMKLTPKYNVQYWIN